VNQSAFVEEHMPKTSTPSDLFQPQSSAYAVGVTPPTPGSSNPGVTAICR